MAVDRLHVCISGRVQGVGFRYATAREANALGLNGWVRNCADGSVEAEFEGLKSRLKDMLDWCRQGPAFAQVTNIDFEWESGEPRYERFGIRGY